LGADTFPRSGAPAGLIAPASCAVAFAPGNPVAPPAWDRFACWSPFAARLGLLTLVLMLLAAALVPLDGPERAAPVPTASVPSQPVLGADEYDQDIALYEAAIRKVRAGRNYYDFIVPEHRLRDYPVRPGLSVRLPTLAYLMAGLQSLHLEVAVPIALMLATIFAWWRRFGEGAGVGRLRRTATALVFVGASLMLNRHYFALHELWAGMLLMLALALHRVGGYSDGGGGGRPAWIASFLCAALALFIRELSLPFVLLMAVTALWHRNWRESAAWMALVVVFVVALAWHLSIIAAQVRPSDPSGSSWLALRGLSGWLANVVQSSNLRFLPHWLAGPVVVLMTLGWAGWRTATGTSAFFLATGYGLAFMIAGRWDNFYWGAMVAPMLMAGIAFAPRAVSSLWRQAALRT